MPLLQTAMTAVLGYVAKLLHDLRSDVDEIKEDLGDIRQEIARAQEWRRNHEAETQRARDDYNRKLDQLERVVFRPAQNGSGK